jgi:hypothetical protein
MTDRRAALVERVARAMAVCEGYDENNKDVVASFEDSATAAVSLIRAETLEEAARVIENNCHDDMTRAEEAAAIRALKEAPCSSS